MSSTIHPSGIACGSTVRDTNNPGDNAIVINTPHIPASEWHVYGRGSVADDNPDYPKNDPVVVVLFEPDLKRAYPEYTGPRPLSLSAVSSRSDVKQYAFPESRLEVVDGYSPNLIPSDRILPHPYHSRVFRPEENAGFIDRIRRQGEPPHPPVVRPYGEYFQLLNGHKRTWACHQAGLDKIPCYCVSMSDEDALKMFADAHLSDPGGGGYSGSVRETALTRLKEDNVSVPDSVSGTA